MVINFILIRRLKYRNNTKYLNFCISLNNNYGVEIIPTAIDPQ